MDGRLWYSRASARAVGKPSLRVCLCRGSSLVQWRLRALQAEAVRGQALEPPVRYIVTDAAALCAYADATDQRLTDGNIVAAEGSTASPAQSHSIAPEDVRANSSADRAETATSQPAVERTAKAASSAARLEGDRLLAPGSFDTVVDTFGLCSHADPVAALQVWVYFYLPVPLRYYLELMFAKWHRPQHGPASVPCCRVTYARHVFCTIMQILVTQ